MFHHLTLLMSFETYSPIVKTRLATDKSAERLTQAANPSLHAGQSFSLLKKCEKDSSFVVFVVFFRYTINGSIDLRTVCFLRRPFRISIVTQTSLFERKAQKGARNAVKTR
jgi:hypothetical protein